MGNIHKELNEFYKIIKLSPNKKEELRKSRNKIRDSIRTYFKGLDEYNIPKFYIQGSMSMNTTIKPLNDEFDIDDGIYIDFKEIDYYDENTWPKTEEIHKIVEKACNPNIRNVEDKNNCVRVTYEKNYHVDFPIYIKDFDNEDFIPKLASKNKGWISSDPKANTEYYKSKEKQYGSILNRMIIYLKAIKDNYCSNSKTNINLSGFEITLLSCENIKNITLNTDDEKVLLNLCKNIVQNLKNNTPLKKPVVNDDLWNDKNDNDKNAVIEFFEHIIELLTEIINENENSVSIALASDLFGEKFHKKERKQIFSFGSLLHKLKLPWCYENKAEISIIANYKKSKHSNRVFQYDNNQLLNKYACIKFLAKVKNVNCDDYEIKWQVTNTGNEAKNQNSLRGDFYDSNDGKFIRKETSLYRGSHIVQGFIVQNGKCIAKSEELIVNIL